MGWIWSKTIWDILVILFKNTYIGIGILSPREDGILQQDVFLVILNVFLFEPVSWLTSFFLQNQEIDMCQSVSKILHCGEKNIAMSMDHENNIKNSGIN